MRFRRRDPRPAPEAVVAPSDADAGVPHADDATVVLYTRRGCHLCEKAEEVVASVCAAHDATWTTVDVDADPALREAFTHQVPVTFVAGRQHDFWSVDPERLSDALRRRG